jgi:hypothetical protein
LEFKVISLVSDGKLPLSNEDIAKYLDETAELLEAQKANEFRVRAYRSAAGTLRGMSQRVQISPPMWAAVARRLGLHRREYLRLGAFFPAFPQVPRGSTSRA